MKKVFTTFGLTVLVLVLTSFTTPQTTATVVDNSNNTEIVNGSIISTRKLDAIEGSIISTRKLDAVEGSIISTRKLDAVNGSIISTRKLD